MKLERSDIDFQVWRKKVDTTILRDGCTPIPAWVMKVWNVENLFGEAISKKHPDAAVTIIFKAKKYKGYVTNSKRKGGALYRLFLTPDLIDELKDVYVMSYMRSIENEMRKGKNYETSVEKDIPFWEFIDIEFDINSNNFHFYSHYTQELIFPELFKNLVNSTVLQQFEKTEKVKVTQSHWKARYTFKEQFSAYNVIYYLIDTKNKLLYIGETARLQRRFLIGHAIIPEWDYYRYDLLPKEFSKELRVLLERMIISSFATFLPNKKINSTILISEYRLVNLKIDQI